jgi:hypothetical protein
MIAPEDCDQPMIIQRGVLVELTGQDVYHISSQGSLDTLSVF